MKILLLGEYSKLHNSLKQGLFQLGHQVTIVGNGDGFKNYPVDYSIKAIWCESSIFSIFRKIIFKVFQFDLIKIEHGIRFYFLLKKLKRYDIVQLINEKPIQTTSKFELYLLKKIFSTNEKVFLLSSGVDYLSVKYSLEKKSFKSVLQPYFENQSLKKEYQYVFEYTSQNHKKLHDYIYNYCRGIIASDIDYQIPLLNNKKFIGLIPNPVNHTDIETSTSNENKDKIVIFLGINRWNYIQKGISFFEKALENITAKYSSKVEIIVAENIPYNEYITLYNKADILLDQCFAHDQGYNALEAMAKGKVVFTGAETEFLKQYNLQENEVCINAKPDVNYLISLLSFLIENPAKIKTIGNSARTFIQKEHDFIKIARKYLEKWENN